MDLSIWPRVSKCCCCISLRVGCLIIGYTAVLISISSLSVTSYSLYRVVNYVKAHRDKPDSHHTPEEIARTAISLYISHAYFMLVFLYYCVFSLLLLIGVHKNRTNYLRYCFNAALVLLVLASVLIVLTCVFFSVLAAFPLLKWCLILFYCLIIIRSTYLEMEEANQPEVYKMHNVIYNPQQAPLI